MGGASKQGGKRIDFIVNTGNPSDAANKKRVRSVAALKSWPERRRKIFEQLESTSTGGRGAFLVEEPKKKVSKTTTTTTTTVERVAGPPRPGEEIVTAVTDSHHHQSWSAPTSNGYHLYHDALSRVPATAKAVEQVHAVHRDTPCSCPQCRHKRKLANRLLKSDLNADRAVPERKKRGVGASEKAMVFSGNMAMITPPSSPDWAVSAGRTDPFNCYPVPYQPLFDQVLHHMMKVYAPRGWSALRITDEQGAHWEWYMTQCSLAEPALFYVRLLFGSGDMVKLGGLRNEIQYWLRAQAIQSINDAIKDPKRCCSDALILAIGRIALHEHMHGDQYSSVHVHRPAQRRMVDMRGGMRNLQIPELIKRLMRWSDRIMAVGSGTEQLLDDEGDRSYSLKETVNAIERWAPHAMPQVRSKVKISDLLNDDD
ncbi:Hypothetical predicted protein [Lecanosticta acicola]|uniref:Uncharacterized protein n=1 Tax=Lecanosticta acicola TaxID=111012 RepID=A0AAI8YUA1_9PEZI|nr:Hypothetical predicted protein [Lecanosticta acicola]